ncbi:MAG: hypothetical protein IPL46_29120 [Saprospiraceae bacterium]|nr:hypothetical protein [Saprospiraceae bacterium]
MKRSIVTLALFVLFSSLSFSQGIIEADEVISDTIRGAHIGDGSRLVNLPNQNLAVSTSGDTLYITEGNFVIIPGLSASNSGNTFANAGADIVNACQTSFNLNASPLVQGTTGLWTILAGTGGNLVNATHPNALFTGQEGESYLLQWTVQHGGGSSSFDQLNISIAVNTETSVANAGQDLFAIMTQSIVLNGNIPEAGSNGGCEILNGVGGILSKKTDPTATFTGVPGQSYTLHWQHYNSCSTSTDELSLTFSESAAGVPSSNGRYFIPDFDFRTFLQVLFPTVMDGDSLVVSQGQLVTSLDLTPVNVNNLDGIQYLPAVSELIVHNQDIKSIPYFSSTLQKFECDCPSLAVVPAFPSNLDTLIGNAWKVQVLPELPNSMRYLEFTNLNNFGGISQSTITFPDLPDNIKYLEIMGWLFTSEMTAIPDNCERVTIIRVFLECCPDQQITQFKIPEEAIEFHIGGIWLDSFPMLPIAKNNLIVLGVSDADISIMPSFADFTMLKSLSLRENNLFKLNLLPTSLESIDIVGNPILCVENKPAGVADQLAEYDICP